MTEARIELTESDPWAAKNFLSAARDRLADAQASISAGSRQVLLHNAAIAACDAVLAINGRQVVGAEGGHMLRLEETAKLLPGTHDDLFERLDQTRMARNEVSYRGGFVPPADADEAAEAVTELLELVVTHVGASLPEWASDDDV